MNPKPQDRRRKRHLHRKAAKELSSNSYTGVKSLLVCSSSTLWARILAKWHLLQARKP